MSDKSLSGQSKLVILGKNNNRITFLYIVTSI